MGGATVTHARMITTNSRHHILCTFSDGTKCAAIEVMGDWTAKQSRQDLADDICRFLNSQQYNYGHGQG